MTPRDAHSPHPMITISRPVYSPTRATIFDVPISTAPMNVVLELTMRVDMQVGERGKADRGPRARSICRDGRRVAECRSRRPVGDRHPGPEGEVDLPKGASWIRRGVDQEVEPGDLPQIILARREGGLHPAPRIDVDLAVRSQPRKRDDLPRAVQGLRLELRGSQKARHGLHPLDGGDRRAAADELYAVDPRQRRDHGLVEAGALEDGSVPRYEEHPGRVAA